MERAAATKKLAEKQIFFMGRIFTNRLEHWLFVLGEIYWDFFRYSSRHCYSCRSNIGAKRKRTAG